MVSVFKRKGALCLLFCFTVLTGCMSKGIEMTEQQQRMARCDQYIEMARDRCLRGDNVTIDDYNEEYKGFEKHVRAKQEALEKAELANEAIKAKKLEEALKNSKAAAEKARQAEIDKQLKQLEDGTN